MDSFSLGPFLLSTPRALALLSLLTLLGVAALCARGQRQALSGWAFNAGLGGLIGARLVYVLQNLEAFRAEPLSTLFLWQAGFAPAGAAVGALLYALWVWYRQRPAPARLAVPLVAAGLVWGVGSVTLQLLAPNAPNFPPLTLQKVNGEPIALQQFAGRPVVLNLWATWCPPCRREMPLLEELAAAHPDVVFLLANQGEDGEQVARYLDQHGLELEWVVLDPAFILAEHFDVRGYPTTLFFDAEGRQLDRYVGELSRALLLNRIDRLRAASAP